ncbi:hypothetical protein GmHk_17G049008 [Glycine max]|nr:hypothetical protein GmHk_17G049008 [Glycine max]
MGRNNHKPIYRVRPSEIRRIRLGIHIFGMFIYEPSTMYVDGTYVEKDWSVDVDELSYTLCRKLKPLNSDSDVLQLAVDSNGYKLVEIYLEHLIDVPVIDEGEVQGDGEVQGEGEVQSEVQGEVQGEGEEFDAAAVEFGDEDGETDKLDTPPGNEEEGVEREKFPRFRMPEDDANA